MFKPFGIQSELYIIRFIFKGEPYRPSAASTYLTDQQIGGVYSVEQGREIGFTSAQLPLAGSGSQLDPEDTESQYADGLRRQAYIQTLGEI